MKNTHVDDELVEREAQWRAALFELTNYYELVIGEQAAQVSRLESQYAEAAADRDRLAVIIEHHERVLGRIRGTVVWRVARAIGNRRR